jgi:hypothetical protein
MSLSSKEAAETLSDVEQAARRSARAFGYSKAAPHLIMWGVIWVIGYSATDLRPADAGLIWLALVVAGCTIGFLLGRSDSSAGAKYSWRFLGIAAILCLFIGATYTLMWPVSGSQTGAFIPLLFGTIYAGVGLWLGMRFLITGVAMIVLTLGGYFYLHEHFLLWQAFVGGGGLILAGIWFRTV